MKFEGISVSGTSVFLSEPNFVWICATAIELWPLKWIFKMAVAAILDFVGMKFDLSGSRGWPVSIYIPVEDISKGGRPPSWIFTEVKFEGIFVSGTSGFLSEPTFVWICAIANELWPLRVMRTPPSWRWGTDGLKCPFKFCVDLIFLCLRYSNFNFSYFWLENA